jgi:hypothetical protein
MEKDLGQKARTVNDYQDMAETILSGSMVRKLGIYELAKAANEKSTALKKFRETCWSIKALNEMEGAESAKSYVKKLIEKAR